MSNFHLNKDVRLLSLGIKVSRPAAALPSTALGSIFTITGGRVAIVSLTGSVVTLLSGTNSTTVGLTPTYNATSAPAILSTAGVIPVAAGSPVVSKLDGGALIVTVNGSALPATPYVTVPGAVTITTGSTVTGTVAWDLVYIPLDDAATVTAA